MKLKLVADWRDFLKWYETWAAMLGMAGVFAWHHIPQEWQGKLMDSHWGIYIAMAGFGATMLGSLVAQPKLPGAAKDGGA
jgi:hypothetical protein